MNTLLEFACELFGLNTSHARRLGNEAYYAGSAEDSNPFDCLRQNHEYHEWIAGYRGK